MPVPPSRPAMQTVKPWEIPSSMSVMPGALLIAASVHQPIWVGAALSGPSRRCLCGSEYLVSPGCRKRGILENQGCPPPVRFHMHASHMYPHWHTFHVWLRVINISTAQGGGCAEFNWFENELMSDSSEVRFKWFGCDHDLRFKWFWLSVDSGFKWFGCQLAWDSSDLVVNWFGIQVVWMSNDLRFKWFGCQPMCDSSDLVVNWFEIQVIWLSMDLRFGRQMIWDVKNEAFNIEAQKRSFCARLPSKMKLRSSKTKLLCETSFRNEALKIKNEAFLRDFLQKRSFEDQKRSFSARLPSKTKLWRSKTKLFCETSFKIDESKMTNEAFLRDFLQKWSFEAQKRSFSARLPSKMTCRPDTWPQNYNTF